MLPTVAALGVVTLGWPRWRHVAVAALAVLASTVIAVALAGGSVPGDVVDAVARGCPRLLSTEWPSPRSADLVGTVTMGVAVATAVAAGLASARRSHLAPLVPLLLGFVAVAAASAPAGRPSCAWPSPASAALVLAALGGDAPPRERARALVRERRLLPTVGVAVVVGIAASLGLSMTGRADPRDRRPARGPVRRARPDRGGQGAAGRSSRQSISTPSTLDGDTMPARWRTAAVDTFDGEQWRTAVTLRPIGRRLGSGGDRTRDVEVEFRTDDLDLVPLPGAAVTVDGPVETDAGRRWYAPPSGPLPDRGSSPRPT